MTKLSQKRLWLLLVAAGLLQVGGPILPGAGRLLAASPGNHLAPGSPLLPAGTQAREARINVATQPGADIGEKLAACIRQLAPAGGICDATSISGRQTSKADPFAGAGGMVKVLLGHVTIETSHAWGLPDRTELAGEGRDTVLRLAPGANSNLIVNAGEKNGNHGISIHDLTLDGNNANETGAVSTIRLWRVSDFSIERVTVLNSVIHGIFLDDGCIRGKLLNNHIENVQGGSGILAGNTPPEAKVSFLAIRGNEISKVAKGDGIFVLGAARDGEHTREISITGNTLNAVKDTSIEVGDGSQTVTVSENKVVLGGAPGGSSGSTGISVRSASGVRVSGNTVTGDPVEHDQVGLFVWSPADDRGGPLSDVTMENNIVSTVGGYGIKVHSGSSIHLVKNKVTGSKQENILVTNKATGVTQQGNIQK